MALLMHRESSPDTATTAPPTDAPTPQVRGTSRRWWVQRGVAIGLWVLVGSGVALGGLALARPTPSTQLAAAPAAEAPRWDVVGFAEIFVAAVVAVGEGTEASLAPFLGEAPVALGGVVAGEWFASRTSATSVEPLGDDRWAVTVAAELLRRDGETVAAPFVGLGVRFFRVEVVERAGSLVAAGLPGIVAGPAEGAPVDDDWLAGSPPMADDPLADTVERFLAALLTGNGELGRYAAPGSGLRAAAATFDTVTLDRVATRGDGDERRARAWLIGESGPASMLLVYDLHLTRRDGRWEVDAVGTPAAPDPAVPAGTAAPSSITNGG